MKNHLKSKHPDEFRALNKDKATVKPTTVSLAIAGTSSSSVAKKAIDYDRILRKEIALGYK